MTPQRTSPLRSLLAVGALLATLCWISPVRAVAQPIRVEVSSDGSLVLSRLPQVLDQEALRPKLTSGLTTTFSFRVATDRRSRILGGADIGVRYDLWEEAFLLTIRDGLGATTEVRTADQPPADPSAGARQPTDQLKKWWSTLQIPLAPAGSLGQQAGVTGPSRELVITLTVLPFSSGELADTKRWLSRTGATGRRRRSEPGNTAQTSSYLFDLLLGTSLERKALFSKKWTVRVSLSVDQGRTP